MTEDDELPTCVVCEEPTEPELLSPDGVCRDCAEQSEEAEAPDCSTCGDRGMIGPDRQCPDCLQPKYEPREYDQELDDRRNRRGA